MAAIDAITWTNPSRKVASIFVDTYIDTGISTLDAIYHLEVTRLKK
jgi:hypothetical protein